MTLVTHDGDRLYRQGDLAECATAYRSARRLATTEEGRTRELESRFWEGCALHGLGRLWQALDTMTPAFTSRRGSLDEGIGYRLATRCVRVLAELPTERAALEDALEEIETELARLDRHAWSTRTRLARARLHLSTGRWQTGLEAARTALDGWEEDDFSLTWCSYAWVTVLLSIWCGQVRQAFALLDRWGKRSDGRRNWLSCRHWLRCHALRRTGRADAGLVHARHAYDASRDDPDYGLAVGATVELARTLLSLGRVSEAGSVVRQALRFRHAEVGDYAVAVRVLVGDWHLAEARRLGGLPARDVDFGCEYAAGDHPAPPDLEAARRETRRARRAYAAIRPRATVMDRLLASSLRTWQLELRDAEATRVEAALGMP
jgi:tetratricopeptide (TPR) repeat protein